MRRAIPQPPDAGLLNGLRFGRDPLRFLTAVQRRFPDAAEVPIPGRAPLVVVTDPALVHDALDRPAEFRRAPATGLLPAENGLVQSEGDRWAQQRSIMLPAFIGQQVVEYGDTAGHRSEQVAADLETAADEGQTVDLHRQATALTIRVASEILLGEDIGAERAARFHGWMETLADEFEFSPTGLAPDWVPLPDDPAYERATAEMQAFGEDLIERRREAMGLTSTSGTTTAVSDGGEPTDEAATAGAGADRNGATEREGADMLTLLLRAEDDPDVEFGPNQIRDEVVTFLIAGHETTALSITYTLAALSAHPEVRERVRAEARSVLGDATPRYEHTETLSYTRRVLQETLRLYPAAWAVFREAASEVRLGEYRVKDGSAVLFPQYAIHRDERYFEAPSTFDPDRWTRRSPGSVDAYFPFGSGPHACIGRQFALTGATLAVASLIREFDIDVPADTLSDFRVTPTLRPTDTVAATISRAG